MPRGATPVLLLSLLLALIPLAAAEWCSHEYTFCGWLWEECQGGYSRNYIGAGTCQGSGKFRCTRRFCCDGYMGSNCEIGKCMVMCDLLRE